MLLACTFLIGPVYLPSEFIGLKFGVLSAEIYDLAN